MSLAFLYPGQGSQYVGMCSKYLEAFPYLKDLYAEADEALGFKISDICFNGPDTELVKTEFTQPAILTCSVAMNTLVNKELGLKADYVAGHSLGEYTALVASGALNFADAVKIVNIRGKLMQSAVPVGIGGMAALKKCPDDLLKEAIAYAVDGTDWSLAPANYNSDAQLVISGHKEAVEKALVYLKERKIRGILLNVSAPFHSPLMTAMEDDFKTHLDKINLNNLNIPYIANVDAKIYTDSSSIKENLLKQLSGSVMWKQTLYTLKNVSINKTIEIGPGRVLSGLSMKTDAGVNTISVDQLTDISSEVKSFLERTV